MSDMRELARLFRGPPAYRPQTPWGPLSTILVTAALSLAATVALGAGVFIALWSGAGEIEVDAFMERLAHLGDPWGLALAMLSQLVSLAILWLVADRSGRRREVLRLVGPHPGWGTCVAAGLLVVALTGLFELVLYAAFAFDPFADAAWLDEGLRSPLWPGTVLVAVVLAPLWEELAFRGFLLSALAQTPLGFWPGALLANALWTLLHLGYSAAGLASVFAAGLALTWLMWRRGSMRLVVVAHALANVAALAFTYVFAPVAA